MTANVAVEPLGTVERLVVFRALVLGDLLCATPALRALRHAYPRAHIALVGLPAVRALVERLASVDEFIEFPGHPALPEIASDGAALPAFAAWMRSRRFDLALQLHGSGGIVNPLVASFGARRSAGFAAPGAWRPDADAGFFPPWPDTGHEIDRLLALTDHLGLPRRGRGLDFPLTPADRAAFQRAWPELAAAPYACVHAGAQLASRRWPPERYAKVADGLAARGWRVVLTGTTGEAAVVAEVGARMHAPYVDLAGRTDLWTLGALLEGAGVLVCNDTGVSHVAAALDTPSVVVSCGADVARWAPLDARRHVVLWAPLPCRPCGHRDCPVGHGCATAVEPAQVLAEVDALVAGPREAAAPIVAAHSACGLLRLADAKAPIPSHSQHNPAPRLEPPRSAPWP